MRTIAQAAWRVAAHGVYQKSLTCGIIHAMKISRKVVVAAAIAPFAVLAVHAAAVDTTVSNGFWCTWSYARETPAVAHGVFEDGLDTFAGSERASVPGVEDAFDSEGWTMRISNTLGRFCSRPPLFTIVFR